MKFFNRRRETQESVGMAPNANVDVSSRSENAAGVGGVIVLGTGCASCRALHKNALDAVKNLGLDLDVKYVTSVKEIMAYGVTNVPALVVDENVVASGRVLKVKQIEDILANR